MQTSCEIMKLLLWVLLASTMLLMVRAGSVKLSEEEQIARDKSRREETLRQREAEYHKQLHLQQERTVAAMRRPRAGYEDTPTNPDDMEALRDLYHSTNGPKWVNNTGWLKGDPCHYPYWYGIYCIKGRVLQIDMVYNGLSGPLPSSLSRASALQVLRLYSNLLTGEIPPDIFGIPSLQVLDLNTNQLSGRLPSGITLANLTQLVLYGNNITSVFPRDFDAPNLQLLEVSSNSLSGNLPEGLSRSTGLTDLVVSRNRLTGVLPASYGSFTKLQRLWTFYNNFDRPTIPSSYSSMVNMEEVQADGLSGQLPDWIGTSWSRVKYLVLINGWLSGEVPQSLCNLREVQSLRLFNNSLKGALPDCICDMEKATDIEISDNQLTGKIPDVFQSCRNLELLYLSRNNLTGTFPASLGSPVNLTVIDVSSNALYGTIPNSLNKLASGSIAELAICFNMFSDIDKGLDEFFKRIVDYTCLFYNNPWSCPLTAPIPKDCNAECSDCNARAQHQSCPACLSSSGCGWCQLGGNCLEGDSQGPESTYKCMAEDWKVGTC